MLMQQDTMTLPNVDMNLLEQPTLEKVQAKELDHPPRILLLYGSNRERSYSRLAVLEAGRILEHFGAEVKYFIRKDCLYLKIQMLNIQK
jgi:arsenic resistance protein ArsH